MTENQGAFLDMIAHSEGSDKAPDPYRVTFAYRYTIVDLNYHPAEARPPSWLPEWSGVPLDFLGPKYTGLVSTAAGRYQIMKHTWDGCQATLALKDFTGPSQDDAALLLIKQKGALDLVNSGEIVAAIQACSGIWASFPGSTSGQPQQRLANLIQAYTEAGGGFA